MLLKRFFFACFFVPHVRMKCIYFLISFGLGFAPPKWESRIQPGSLRKSPKKGAVGVIVKDGNRVENFDPPESSVFKSLLREPGRRSTSSSPDAVTPTIQRTISVDRKSSEPGRLIIDTSPDVSDDESYSSKKKKRMALIEKMYDGYSSAASLHKKMQPEMKRQGVWASVSTVSSHLTEYRRENNMAREWVRIPKEHKEFISEWRRENPSGKRKDAYEAFRAKFGENGLSEYRFGIAWGEETAAKKQ
jgi:hypothetical protein